jgi:Recombination endonuclease VII
MGKKRDDWFTSSRVCTKCRQEKPASAYYAKNDRGNAKRGCSRCRECCKRDNERSRIPRQYGISLEEYTRLIAEQSGVCKVCKGIPDGMKSYGRLHLDHDHATGKVRGLLCGHCNRALGGARDNPAILRALAVYLEQC